MIFSYWTIQYSHWRKWAGIERTLCECVNAVGLKLLPGNKWEEMFFCGLLRIINKGNTPHWLVTQVILCGTLVCDTTVGHLYWSFWPHTKISTGKLHFFSLPAPGNRSKCARVYYEGFGLKEEIDLTGRLAGGVSNPRHHPDICPPTHSA